MRKLVPAVLLLLACSFCHAAYQPNQPITITVDATDAHRNLFHARLVIPVSPGPTTLFYSEWIPGEHEPSGPINDLAGLKFTAGGKTLTWRRDDVNAYAFHLDVPRGANALEVALDYLGPVSDTGFSSSSNATEELGVVSWNQVLLYPEGATPKDLIYSARLRLPARWKFATALESTGQNGDILEFRPVDLVTLIDSPVIAGAHFRVLTLTPEVSPPHRIDIVADSEEALAVTPSQIAGYNQMVRETGAMFDARHYQHYDFLVSLSDHIAHFGLEHHQSSDNRMRERAYIDGAFVGSGAGLLTHEFVHSWNGKFRRPIGLATRDYQEPMRDDLLWVYEGLTDYLGEVLAGRSGLYTPDEYRQHLAIDAAQMDNNAGRQWRPLIDTAVASPVLLTRDRRWEAWRRSSDYYQESALIWLEADTIMRQRSHGQRSMDDFCHLFFGGANNGPEVKTYTFEDLVNALNQVVAYDWRGFLTDRIYKIQPHAPMGGIENAGWKLVFDEAPGYVFQAIGQVNRRDDARYSIGMRIRTDTGRIEDVVPGFPAFAAGIGPGMLLLAVNGRTYAPDVLHAAITAAKNSSQPIQLQVQNGEFVKTCVVNYHGGDRYPALQRDPGKPDMLSDIIKPHAAAGK